MKTKELCIHGLMIALVTVCTMVFQIPVSATQGYVHLGDSMILLVGVFFGARYGMVAGGIGSGINMGTAVNIGMFPDVPLEKFHYIGNSSLTGAYAMVMSDEANAKTAEVASNMTYLELSTHPGYMDAFVAACFIPHTDSRLFPHSVQEA